MKVLISAICIFLAFVSIPVFGQAFPERAIDDLVQREMRSGSVPGLSLAVVRGGQMVLAKGYGNANVELNARATADTVYQTASVGKQFTAAAILMLVQDGKLGLDDRVGKYIAGVPQKWGNMTIRHLLNHTSGLSNDFDDADYRRDLTDPKILAKILGQSLGSAPGEKFEYSNLGYKLLGFVIAKVTGKFYGDFLQERIFRPAGMATARIISESDIVPNRASGYRLVNGQLKNQDWVSQSMNTTADGSIYLTVKDMAKWDAALYSDKLLSKTSRSAMWSPAILNDGKRSPYGFGWEISAVNGHRIVEHSGEWQGFSTFIARYLDDDLTVIVLTNLADADAEAIAHGIAGVVDSAVIERVVR